jgi:hypothetical protein
LDHEGLPLSHLIELEGNHGESRGLFLGELRRLEMEVLLHAPIRGPHLFPGEEGGVRSSVILHLFLGMSLPKKSSLSTQSSSTYFMAR